MNDELSEPTVPSPSPTEHSSKGLSFPLRIVFSLVGVCILVTVAVYKLPIDNPFVRTVVSLIPYPAVLVNRTTISMNDYVIEREALMHYLQSTEVKELPSQAVLEQAILDALVNKSVVRLLADEAGVKIDQSRVDRFYEEVIKNNDSEEGLARELSETFGWSEGEFKKRIVESLVLAQQMNEQVLKDDTIQAPARLRIEEARARLEKGEEFLLVAKEVNAGVTPPVESDLGVHMLSELPPEWSVLKDLQIGSYTDIIDLPQGFAIFSVSERLEKKEGTQVHLLGIMTPKTTLEELVQQFLDTAHVKYFVK